MRWMNLTAMVAICSASATQAQPRVVQAQLRVHDVASSGWIAPGNVNCKLEHRHVGTTHHTPHVAPTPSAKVKGQGTPPIEPPVVHHPPNHVPGHHHTQSQRISGQKQTAQSPNAGTSLIRLDTHQLMAALNQHQVVEGDATSPQSYRFQVFNGVPAAVTPELVAQAASLDLSSANLASGKLALLASRNTTPVAPTWVVAIRATTSSPTIEGPLLLCILTP